MDKKTSKLDIFFAGNRLNNPLQFCMMASTLTWLYTDHLKADPERRHKVKGRTSFPFSDARQLIAEAASMMILIGFAPSPAILRKIFWWLCCCAW